MPGLATRAMRFHHAFTHLRWRFGSAVALAATAAALVFAPGAAQSPGFAGASFPAGGGTAIAVWGGGSAVNLASAAAAAGCDLTSAWASTGGRLTGYIPGSPDFVNTSFVSLFPGGEIPSGTPLVVQCAASSTGRAQKPAPTPTPSPTPAATATPTALYEPVDLSMWTVNAESSGYVATGTQDPLIPLWQTCSTSDETFGIGLYNGMLVSVDGRGVGDCSGWYVVDGVYWVPADYLSSSPPSAPTPTPTASPTPPPANPPGGGGITVFDIDGQAILVADDGTYLGVVSSSQFASDSICNEFGAHGSPYASESVRNEFGEYGSPYSSRSAYSPYTSAPPMIVLDGEVIGYLTKNDLLPGAVDPDVLFALYDCVY